MAKILADEYHKGEDACPSCFKVADQILSLFPCPKLTLIDEFREMFLKYLTHDSETSDARRKEFNQAIFFPPDDKYFAGRQVFNGTNLDMVMEKFDKTQAQLAHDRETGGK